MEICEATTLERMVRPSLTTAAAVSSQEDSIPKIVAVIKYDATTHCDQVLQPRTPRNQLALFFLACTSQRFSTLAEYSGISWKFNPMPSRDSMNATVACVSRDSVSV